MNYPKNCNQGGQDDDKDDGQNEDEEWTIVPHPETNADETRPSRGISSRSDFTLKWGKRKFTVLRWDVSVTKRDAESQGRVMKERQ